MPSRDPGLLDVVDLARRQSNLIRYGTVEAVDYDNACVRVRSGLLLTDWIPWSPARAGSTSTWSPPSIGEQVTLTAASGVIEAAIAGGALYSTANPPPSNSPSKHVIKFPDGAVISYDHASGHAEITGIVSATLDASGAVSVKAGTALTLDAPATVVTGTLTVQGLLTYQAGLAGTGGGAGTTISGSITQTGGTLSSNGIVLATHTHSGVQPGGGSTGGPQ